MKHIHKISDIPAYAQTEGLCTNVTSDLQARYCFVLAFFSDVFVPIIQPFLLVKASDGISDSVQS